MEPTTEPKPEETTKPAEDTASSTQEEEKKTEQKVTAFEVEAGETGVDYNKLIDQFGCDRINEKHLEKIEELTGQKPHRFLRREIFFSHRSLDW